MTARMIRIVSTDGTIKGTRVVDPDGKIMENVTKVEVSADANTQQVQAVITFSPVIVDMTVPDPAEGGS